MLKEIPIAKDMDACLFEIVILYNFTCPQLQKLMLHQMLQPSLKPRNCASVTHAWFHLRIVTNFNLFVPYNKNEFTDCMVKQKHDTDKQQKLQ